MHIKLVKIGNSFGIRLPKAVIDACELQSDLELNIKGKSLVISSEKQPRAGWRESVQSEVGSKPLKYLGEWEW